MSGRKSLLALALGFVAAQPHASRPHRANRLDRPKRRDQASEEDIDEREAATDNTRTLEHAVPVQTTFVPFAC